MYALSFDMNIAELKEHYGEIYNNAYYEIRKLLISDGFEWIQGSTYLTRSDNLINLTKAIIDLRKIDWFRRSVRDIRGYRVEEWSNFTQIVREEM
jgi:virulence-associated protein VapD